MNAVRAFFLALAVLAAGAAVPAVACRYSNPIFNGGQPARPGELQVKVSLTEMLVDRNRRIRAMRGTVVADTGGLSAGQQIIVIVPGEAPTNCYYFGFASASTIQPDGSILGHVAVESTPERSGAFAAIATDIADRSRYESLAARDYAGARWVPARIPRNVDPASW